MSHVVSAFCAIHYYTYMKNTILSSNFSYAFKEGAVQQVYFYLQYSMYYKPPIT